MGCMHQALACLAHLASHRPCSPCLHQQQQQRRSAPPGRRRRPGCCCEVQARRARPIRGEVSQATQGKVRQPALALSGAGLGAGLCSGPCPASPQAVGPLLGPWPFIWPLALYMGVPLPHYLHGHVFFISVKLFLIRAPTTEPFREITVNIPAPEHFGPNIGIHFLKKTCVL